MGSHGARIVLLHRQADMVEFNGLETAHEHMDRMRMNCVADIMLEDVTRSVAPEDVSERAALVWYYPRGSMPT
eukprot:1845211-Prymnesium_polylepis.1